MQRRTMVRTTLAIGVAALLAGTAIVMTNPASAAEPATEHCVVRVVDREADGRLRTTAPTCEPTRAAALAEVGADLAATWVIGSHYDGLNLTGSSFQVVGDSCIGGWLNLPPEWINRVTSTLHGCGHIRHFDGYDLTGTSQMTVYPGGNLSTLNNRTNSIQYLA